MRVVFSITKSIPHQEICREGRPIGFLSQIEKMGAPAGAKLLLPRHSVWQTAGRIRQAQRE
jgi:hypothetical protein